MGGGCGGMGVGVEVCVGGWFRQLWQLCLNEGLYPIFTNIYIYDDMRISLNPFVGLLTGC